MLSKSEMHEVLGEILLQYQWIFSDEINDQVVLDFILKEKVEKLITSSEIFEMFRKKRILNAVCSNKEMFVKLYNFLANYTDETQRREILLLNNTLDQYFFFSNDQKQNYSQKLYYYSFYDYAPFKILQESVMYGALAFNITFKIYQNNFNQTEIRDLIASSSEFYCYLIDKLERVNFNKFVMFLENLFEDDEKSLKKFLDQKVELTNSTTLEFVDNLVKFSHPGEKKHANFIVFSDLHERVKKKSEKLN